MAEFKFHKGDRVVWFSPEGQVIGTIEKVFKDKCWLQPAGSDRIGDPVIKGVSLDAIELYSSELGPIEQAIAQQQAENNCQPQQLFWLYRGELVELLEENLGNCRIRFPGGESPWIHKSELDSFQIGDRVGFFEDEDYFEGEVTEIDLERKVVWVEDGGEIFPEILIEQLRFIEETDNCQSQQLSDENQDSDRAEQSETAIAPKQPETFWLNIDEIHEHPSFQPRGNQYQPDNVKGIDDDVVDQYAEWLEFSEPPAIEVWFGATPFGEECWWLLAGHHRIRALKKAKRDRIECFRKAQSYEEAIYRASISNAGDERARQLYKMRRYEWGEACKQFLRVCDRLSEDAIAEFLDRAAALTGQSKKWSKLNDSAISAVFGVSRSSVIAYRKTIELERAMQPFEKGTRVQLLDFQDYIHIANKAEYRIGTVIRKGGEGLYIEFDYHRIPHGNFLPEQLKILSAEPPFQQVQFKPGDRVWKDGELGTVISVTEGDKNYLSGYEFGVWSVQSDQPIVFWDRGIHNCELDRALDFEGEGEVPDLEFRIGKMQDYLSSIDEDESLEDYEKKSFRDKLEKQIQKLSPDNCQSQQLSQNKSEPTSVKQEEADKRKELLGCDRPAGPGGAELPAPKKPGEDPQTIAPERPAETRDLSVAQREARRSAALNRYNDLIFDLEVLDDADLKELIKLSKAELTRRHRPSQEGDPELREIA